MRISLFKIYLLSLAMYWNIYFIVQPLIDSLDKYTRNFIGYMLVGGIFIVFEIFFVASFFSEELGKKKAAIIIAFFLSFVYGGIIDEAVRRLSDLI